MDIKDNLRSLNKSFSFAFRGINYCIKNERNMRIHLCAMIFVLSFGISFGVSKIELIALILCIGLVISCEMINTSIETMINLYTPNYNNLARITKDVAAGAVLVTAIISVLVGFIIFFDINQLFATLQEIFNNKIALSYYIVLIISSLIFIFEYPIRYNKRNRG